MKKPFMNELPIDFALGFFNSVALEKAIKNIPNEIATMSLKHLHSFAKPTQIDLDLKHRLWKVIAEGTMDAAKKKQTLGRLHHNICTYTHLYNNVLTNPYKMAWLLKSSVDMQTELEAMQHQCLDDLREIMSLELRRKDGSINHANIRLKVKAMSILFAIKDRG